MKRYLLGMIVLAFAGSAFAAPGPADVQAVVNNLGPTVEALADGLGNTVNNMITTTTANGQPSAVQTSADLGTTLINTGNALISGSPTLGAAGLLLGISNSSIQQVLHPALNAIDNPTSANIQAALAPEDLNTIVANLQGVPFAAIEGGGGLTYGQGLRSAAIATLEGRLGGLGDAAIVSGIASVDTPLLVLLAGTNYAPLATLVGIGGIGVLIATQDQVAQIQPYATQLADAGAPLTAPVIGILKKGF